MASRLIPSFGTGERLVITTRMSRSNRLGYCILIVKLGCLADMEIDDIAGGANAFVEPRAARRFLVGKETSRSILRRRKMCGLRGTRLGQKAGVLSGLGYPVARAC